jgi:hypothetical protein
LLLDESTFTFGKLVFAQEPGDGASATAMTPADWGAEANAFAPVEASVEAPAGFALTAVHPNPTCGAAALTLTVDRAQPVTAAVFDVQGRRVATVFDGEAGAGVPLDLAFDTDRFAPGVYVVRVSGATFAESRRLVVVR